MSKLWWNWGEDCFKIFSSHDRVLGPRIQTYMAQWILFLRDEGCSLSFSLYPESQSTKKNSANRWGNYDENYDENAVKTVSKIILMFCTHEGLLGPRIRTWHRRDRGDMVILSVRFLWRAHTRGISLFSLAYGRWRSRPGQATRPRIRSIRSLSMCPSLNYGGIQ